MANALSEALVDLLDNLKIEAGETVTYRRGAHSVSVTAVAGRKERNAVLDDGLAMATDELEFKLEPGDLVLNSVQVLPERGDEIVRTVGTKTHTYVVRAESGLPCYSVDPLTTCLTVRAKREAIA
jgi:hypothetical protein